MRQFIKESEKELINQLYKDNYGRIYRFFLKRLGSSEDAADAAQEVFKRFIGRNRVATLDSPAGYLWRITHNLIKEIRRTFTIRSRWMSPPTEDADEYASMAPGPEEALQERQMMEGILRALNKLPARSKEVFILHRFKGLSHKEIAIKLNISPKTVENHMVNALLALRKHLPRY